MSPLVIFLVTCTAVQALTTGSSDHYLSLPVESTWTDADYWRLTLNGYPIKGVLFALQETCPSSNEEIVLTLDGLLRCCSKCPPGEGMLQLCTNQTQTACRACHTGSEFSLFASATAKCTQCKRCLELHPFAKFRTHCTPTQDAVCECIAGYFFLEAQSTCQSCTRCPSGQGAIRTCGWNEDSICEACSEGTWSSSESATSDCQPCRKCKSGQIEMRPCSPTQNTLCCPLDNPNCLDSPENDESDDIQSPEAQTQPTALLKEGEDYPMIAIYCSLLGLVIFTLLVYVLYKIWQQCLNTRDVKRGGDSHGEYAERGDLQPTFVEFSNSHSGTAASSVQSNLNKQPEKSSITPKPKSSPERQKLLTEPQQYSDNSDWNRKRVENSNRPDEKPKSRKQSTDVEAASQISTS